MKRGCRLNSFSLLTEHTDFDVVILGGGINGACVYDQLCRQGYKVLLLDKGDFACGTSQTSAMMIWGGLLYMRNLDFPTVFQLCRDRDRMIEELPNWVYAQALRYLPLPDGGRNKLLIHAALWLYWLISSLRRERPHSAEVFSERALLKDNVVGGSLTFEEALLSHSDARFVLQWITPYLNDDCVALNYCESHGEYHDRDHRWYLDIEDKLTGEVRRAKGRLIVNCAGVWTDEVNRQFGIESPFCHALSKGVFLIINRSPLHETLLVFDLGEHGDVINLIPWGPVALWGPTETAIEHIEEGLEVTAADVSFLWKHYHNRFSQSLTKEDILSFRCGIRPLAVPCGYRNDRYPLDLSRKQQVVVDTKKPWISCYGGKLTGCQSMAQKVVSVALKRLPTPAESRVVGQQTEEIEWCRFEGVEGRIPSAAYCRDHEFCCNLDDYLRRRTNISQWIAHEGLGAHHENLSLLEDMAFDINGGDRLSAEREVALYSDNVLRRRTKVLSGL